MIVTVRGIGDLSEYFGKQPRAVELAEGARIRDLLERIEVLWGAGLPAYLWDFEQHRFRGPVVMVINKKAVMDMDAPLSDGIQVGIMRAVAGG